MARTAGLRFLSVMPVGPMAFSGFSEAEAGCGALHASRQPRNLPVACAPAPEKPLNAPGVLGDAPKQLVKAHSRPARGEASAIAGEQPIAAQLPHSALHGVLFAAPQIGLDPQGQLQDRELSGVQEQDLREDRAFHDLVLMRGRKQAPPDIVVVHGKALLSCATPPAVSAARGHFVCGRASVAGLVELY